MEMKKRDFWITYGDRNDKPIEPCQFHTAGDGLHLNVFHSPVVTVTEGWSGCQALDIQVRRGSPLVQVSVALRGVLEKAVAPHSSTLAMDGGAWWAIVHGVAKSQTGLTDFTFTLSSGHRSGKVQFSFQSQRMLKLLHNCTHLTH